MILSVTLKVQRKLNAGVFSRPKITQSGHKEPAIPKMRHLPFLNAAGPNALRDPVFPAPSWLCLGEHSRIWSVISSGTSCTRNWIDPLVTPAGSNGTKARSRKPYVDVKKGDSTNSLQRLERERKRNRVHSLLYIIQRARDRAAGILRPDALDSPPPPRLPHPRLCVKS